MATVHDDLLNDFGSSGEEEEDQLNDGLVRDEKPSGSRDVNGSRDAMDVDGLDDDEEGSDDEQAQSGVNDADDAEATKVKVEKMQLGAVKDVRSVASLMSTLEPVLEVSPPTLLPYPL